MTNFEMITKDEVELAGWLSDARIGCDMCPVETECSKDEGPIYDRCYRLILEWLERDEETEERRTCQDFRHVETRREFFMENPDEFEEWLRKINDREVRYPVDKHRARTDKKYIGTCMCSNMNNCDVCPVPLDEDGLCGEACDEWLDSPMGSEPSDIVPDSKKNTIWSSNIRRALKTVRTNSLIHDSQKTVDEPKIDAETVIKFISQNFGVLCEWDFDDEDCGDYMDENHPEICEVCRMRDEDICKCWETYIREKSQEEEK